VKQAYEYRFLELLPVIAEVTQPRQILEWGPGRSTVTLADCCPGARIVTIEHDAAWYRQWHRTLAQHAHGAIEHLHLSRQDAGRAMGYVTWPLTQLAGWELILVDGRSRVDCLRIAQMVCAVGGAVVLHDADRSGYEAGLRGYTYVHRLGEPYHTAVCSVAEKTHDRLREALRL